ncbi:MAG: thiamine pyrophosphate-binding protein [Betaproteobacteria bacterium]|nr:thiamine pyrophosphate-binding protein [Betaproteobacteria bacterium]
MSGKIPVGDLVAECLKRIGVRVAFGIISVHNTPLLDAINRRGATRFVMVRGEMGGTHMADAYARVSGALGVVITSTGPGAASAASGLVEARFAGSPVLHITSQSSTRFIDRDVGTVHDVPDQLAMLRSVSKAAYRVHSAATVMGTLMHAAAQALTPPMGPVSVEIPIDVQMAQIDRPHALTQWALPLPPVLAPAPQALDALVSLVGQSSRPLLWTGNGARGAGYAIARLAQLGIPVATSWNGRGVLPEDHPLSIGPLATLPEFERFYAEVDLLIVAGSRVRGHETRDGAMALPARRVHIDVDQRADGRTFTNALFVHADAALTLSALAQRLDGHWRAANAHAESVGRVKAEAVANYRRTLGTYQTLPDIVRDAMPRDAIWVRDISFHQTTWANRIFPVYGPRDSIYSVGAAIGTGMPLAIGAALAAPGRKTVAMCGDGGFLLNLGELWTAVQEKPDVCFLVMNDQGYGVIRHIQDATYDGRRFYDHLLGPQLELLAKSAPMPYWRVTRLDQLGAALQAALRQHGPTLVELDMAAIGPFQPRHSVPSYAAPR